VLAIDGHAVDFGRGRRLPAENAGPDLLRYRFVPPNSRLAIAGLGADGRTARREVVYEGPEPLELEWP